MQVFGRAHVLAAVLQLCVSDDEGTVLQDFKPLYSGVGGHEGTWKPKAGTVRFNVNTVFPKGRNKEYELI